MCTKGALNFSLIIEGKKLVRFKGEALLVGMSITVQLNVNLEVGIASDGQISGQTD